MAKDAIIFACANPTPEIFPDEAKAGGARRGRHRPQRLPQPGQQRSGIPRHFPRRAGRPRLDINDEMKVAAAYALAGLVSDSELNEDYILPAAFDPRVKDAVAAAVAEAARKSGVARI
jgi:malate dehydrogenase (oxaloacetate-decarboxylating)